MKNDKLRGLGGATLITSLAAIFVLAGTQHAFAEEAVSTGQGEVAIFDGPEMLPPSDGSLPSEPPREGNPGHTPNPQEPVLINPTLEPNPTPPTPPRESQNPAPEVNSIQTVSPAEPVTTPAKELTVSATQVPAPVSEVAVPISKPALIAEPVMAVTLQLPAGSKVLTTAAKATLSKTADAVKKGNKPASIAIKTAGTTVAKATAQANAIVAELKKRGVSAVTVIKRVGTKTSVSVLVTKKKP
jgi:hypothetical protein